MLLKRDYIIYTVYKDSGTCREKSVSAVYILSSSGVRMYVPRYGVALLCLIMLSLQAEEKPTIRVYVKDFLRSTGQLSDYKCPEFLAVRDLLNVGLCPVG